MGIWSRGRPESEDIGENLRATMLRNQISDGYDSNHTAPVNQRPVATQSWRNIAISLKIPGGRF